MPQPEPRRNCPVPDPLDTSPPVLRPGATCWRLEHADRVAFIIDAADYYSAVKAAMLKAKQSIILLGWDFDTRVGLESDPPDHKVPNRFGEFLERLVETRPKLRIHVLKWDFSMIFALEREIFPTALLDLMTHTRVSFRLDGEHPAGACHHQKLVVIDDAVAFCGGIDITANRWDTSEHLDHDIRRRRPNGELYDPFHDMMMAVDGKAAAALGELARYRWHRGTGEPPMPPATVPSDPWPDRLRADLRDVEVGIARTLPRHGDQAEAREVEALYVASIAAARRLIYIESQYFTAECVGQALLSRLGDPDGPEIVVVTPLNCPGWLEEELMGRARRHLVNRLRKADTYGKFAIFGAVTPAGVPVTIHSKTMVVDDTLMRIGSSNLNNRSMGFDTECDLAIEAVPGKAGCEARRKAIRRYRDRLLAEHLGAPRDAVAAKVAETGSLLETIRHFHDPKGHRLEPVRVDDVAGVDSFIAEIHLFDPEKPVTAEELTRQIMPDLEKPTPRLKFGLAVATLALLLAGLAALWRFTGLSELATVDGVLDWAQGVADMPFGPLIGVAAYVVGGFVMFPVMVLIAATAIVLGPVWGFATAISGCLASAAVLFWVGRLGGRRWVRRFGGRFVNKISRRLADQGILAVAVIRVIPVAPFSVVNVVAGASHLRFTDYVIGTALGMAPGVLAFSLLGSQLERTLREPTPASIGIAAGIALVAASLGWIANKLLGGRMKPGPARKGETATTATTGASEA
ncbi:VTT domain-containing protein [Skermanella rosea]|uniref:VTT domain-containing protein n=1 Tax=Skermanella rosea TaxID=1817965 RepID=UPI0019325E8F|nr:VTT domain-containing protein [Skermanella rosea]UEM02784.1 VTT domain-containing protein [Skermanella rosea]